MSKVAESTRARLVQAAEQLFAEKGIDAVSLREVNRASGARNAVALQYHFDNRAGVLRAILDKHLPDVEAGRHSMLDQYEREGLDDLRVLAAALVGPMAAKLSDPDGGPEFLQIYADLVNRPQSVVGPVLNGAEPSLARWRALVEPLLDEHATRLHRRFTAVLHAAIELGRRARAEPHADKRLFVSWLIDVVVAILAAPVSDETRRLAGERDTARKAKRRSTH